VTAGLRGGIVKYPVAQHLASRRAAAITAALVAWALSSSFAQPPQAGSITGHVTLTARVRAPLPANAYPSRSIGKHDAAAAPEIRNVVVYLKDPAFRGVLPVSRVDLHQQNETFLPHVLAITKGSTVEFPNDDPFFHNVFSFSSAASFNLGRYPRGQSKPQKFMKAGLVKVFCDIHSHMSASILVLDHPYFAIPAVDGTYEIPNVPPGQYTLVGWHERVGERTALVRVEAGRPTNVDLTVPVEDAR
jgi:plastocyanin